VAMQHRISQNLTLPARERYLNFIQQYPQFEQRIPLRQIASYLGIAPESLSRIRKQMMRR
jgi:hypothetical protein